MDDTRDERRLDPGASDALDARRSRDGVIGVAVQPSVEERGLLRIDHSQARGVSPVAQVAADRRRGAARTGSHDDPLRHRVRLECHLVEDRFRDVVVAAPVRRSLGVRELVHVVPARFLGEPPGHLVDLACVVDEMTAAVVAIDQGELLRARRAGHDSEERQAQQLGEVGLGHGGRSRRGLDDRGPSVDPAVRQAVQEQRAGEAVFQRPGRVRRLVLEIELDAPVGGEREGQQVGVRRAVGVRLDRPHGVLDPYPVRFARPVEILEGHQPRLGLPGRESGGSRMGECCHLVCSRCPRPISARHEPQ